MGNFTFNIDEFRKESLVRHYFVNLITGIDARVGDEVIVYGNNPSVIELAEAIDTIPYELLTNISDRVKRVYYMD